MFFTKHVRHCLPHIGTELLFCWRLVTHSRSASSDGCIAKFTYLCSLLFLYWTAYVSFRIPSSVVKLSSSLVYANSLLAALNSRNIIHGKVDDVDIRMVSIPSSLLSTNVDSNGTSKIPTNISIRIDTTKGCLSDHKVNAQEVAAFAEVADPSYPPSTERHDQKSAFPDDVEEQWSRSRRTFILQKYT